ncbi:MAG: hypothetical protein MO846_08350 [Candidatus Devosia symbiotica]|nr:hypothetical protein [Candidatus Devosia symbiotica]
MTSFDHILANNLLANITNFIIWFAITFRVFLEIRSVFITGMIAVVYPVFTAGSGRSLITTPKDRHVGLELGVSVALCGKPCHPAAEAAKVPLPIPMTPNLWGLMLLVMLGSLPAISVPLP